MITVVIEGGKVAGLVSDEPELVGEDFEIVDYDTEGGDQEEVKKIFFKDGTHSTCYHEFSVIEKSTIDRIEEIQENNS